MSGRRGGRGLISGPYKYFSILQVMYDDVVCFKFLSFFFP